MTIMKVRAKYSSIPVDKLYNRDLMPSDLLEAHLANDRAVKYAYGLQQRARDLTCMKQLFEFFDKNILKKKQMA